MSTEVVNEDWIKLDPHYNGVYVVLAYVVAVVGAWTTLELLLRRTGNAAKWNALLLIGAGVSFGSTATWGMHFVGNQAVTLHYPAESAQTPAALSYDVGFTLLSLVVACLSMAIAFSCIGLRLDSRHRTAGDHESAHDLSSKAGANDGEQLELEHTRSVVEDDKGAEPSTANLKGRICSTHWRHPRPSARSVQTFTEQARTERSGALKLDQILRPEEEDDGEFGVVPTKVSFVGATKIIVAGCICGGGIAAMHYVGQLAINSVPRVENTPYLVFLSILIAMVAVSAGLFLLFVVLRPKLQHRWYKRAGIAMILALATTLMHFVALLGTQYYTLPDSPSKPGTTSRHLILALVSVVAPICCLALLVFAFFGQQRLLRQIAARHRIVVATAVWDSQGHLLVRPEDGLLPFATIFPDSDQSNSKGVLESLGLRNRLSLESSNKKLAIFDHAFIALIRASWAWKDQAKELGDSSQAEKMSRRRGSEASNMSEPNARDYGARQFASLAQSKAPARPSSTDDEEPYDHNDGENCAFGPLDDDAYDRVRKAVAGFEVAAKEIALELTGAPDLHANGVLFDRILNTGHFEVSSRNSGHTFTVTQGQLLMLTRRIRSRSERDALVDRGYIFVEPTAAARVTSAAFAAPSDRVLNYFRDAHRFVRFMNTRRFARGRLYGGALLLQAVPGEGLQLVVDEKQHHSLPMIELASLIRSGADRVHSSGSTLPLTTLESITHTLQQLRGRSLLELVNASLPFSAESAQIHSLLAHVLRPFLDRTFSPECMEFLLPRLLVTPSLIPLTNRPGNFYGADGLSKDSYLVCLKAVIPSSIALPGEPLNWLPYSLHKSQADCVARYERLRRVRGVLETSTPSAHGSAVASSPSSSHANQGFTSTVHRNIDKAVEAANNRTSMHSRMSDHDDTTDDEGGVVEESEAAFDEPEGLQRFDPNFIEFLIRDSNSLAMQALPLQDLRRSGANRSRS